MRKPPARYRLRVTSFLLAALSWFAISAVLQSGGFAQPVLRTGELWRQVYQLMPDLPLENQYVNKDTREVSTSTLISRLIQYHTTTKRRSPLYRLDWKLTLADYLGVNEGISSSIYPGANALRTNPLEGDRAAIQKLNRVQRDALVQALVTTFSPAVPADSSGNPPVSQPSVSPSPSVSPNPSVSPSSPRREPRPGDANLLLTP